MVSLMDGQRLVKSKKTFNSFTSMGMLKNLVQFAPWVLQGTWQRFAPNFIAKASSNEFWMFSAAIWQIDIILWSLLLFSCFYFPLLLEFHKVRFQVPFPF